MRRNHPPLPSAIRPVYWILRTVGTIIGAASIVVAVLVSLQGRGAFAALILALGVSFAVLTWLPPTSRWHMPLLAVLGVAVVVWHRNWLIAALLFAAIAWSAWSRRRIGPLPGEFEITEVGAVMKNAGKFLDSFESLGFEQVGAYRARIGPVWITVSLLLSPDRESYASVTDAVLEVTSLFPDGRTLITRNSNLNALPERALINPLSGATPESLVAGHGRALETLAEHGHFPTPLTASELAQIAVDSELGTVEWMKEQRRARRPDDTAVLWDRPDAAERIAAWQGGA